MRATRRCLAGLASLLALLQGGGAAAQMFENAIDTYMPGPIDRMVADQVQRDAYAEEDFVPVPEAEVSSVAERLSFVPDEALRREALSALRAKVAERSPEDAAAFGEELFTDLANALRPYGLSVNDLADATAVYLGELWDAANGTNTQIDRRVARALADQFDQTYAVIASEEAALSDPAIVQRQSDLYLLQAYLIGSLRMTLAGPGTDPADAAEFRAAMRRLGRDVFGIDLTRAAIDERGLTPGAAAR